MLRIAPGLLERIQSEGERAYPEEGAGFLLGSDGDPRTVVKIIALDNAQERAARGNRYLISAEEYMRVEREAETQALDVLGVFHSHPDHPNRPSDFDREWAQPGFSYVITSVSSGKAAGSRAWRLTEDRSGFSEEEIQT